MTERREIEARLVLYEDLSGILGAMKSFALAELRRVDRREQAQQAVLTALAAALRELAPALPAPPRPERDLVLLFGSSRGFCGSFNEDLLRAWRAAGLAGGLTVVVGERLAALMPADASCHRVPGAIGSADAGRTIDALLATVGRVRASAGEELGIVVWVREEGGVRTHRVLPLAAGDRTREDRLPLTNEAPARVAAGVAEHYLFHLLLALLLQAVRVENHMRLMQMENAMRHLERSGEDLERRRNRLRQEEIIEEIELVARKRDDS